MKKRNGKYYQLFSNTILFALGNFGSKFLVFLLVPLYTNALTTSEYGTSEILITGTNLIIPFVSISIQDATLRFALDKKNNKGQVIKNTMLVLGIGTIVSIFLFPLVRLYKPLSDWAAYFVAISIVYMIRNALSVYVKAIGKSKLFAIDSVLYTALLMGLNILFLAVLHLGLKGYFFATIIKSSLSILLLVIVGNVLQDCVKSTVNGELLREMIRFSLPMILNNVSWWVINSSDKVMIEYFMSVGDSGIYSVAAKMPSLIAAVTSIFNQAWVISSVSEYDSTRDTSFFSNIFSAFNTVIILFASFIILIIKPFMQIYVGPSFVSCWQYVPLLLLGSIFQSYATFFGAIYTSAKKNITVMTTTIIAAVINIILNAILIQTIGVQGAVIATAVAYFVVFVFRMIDSQKYIRFTIDYIRVVFSVLLLTGQCLITIKDKNAFLYSSISFIALIIINWRVIHRFVNLTLVRIKN